MKYFRCPWCGKANVYKNEQLNRYLPFNYYYGESDIYDNTFEYTSGTKCEHCDKWRLLIPSRSKKHRRAASRQATGPAFFAAFLTFVVFWALFQNLMLVGLAVGTSFGFATYLSIRNANALVFYRGIQYRDITGISYLVFTPIPLQFSAMFETPPKLNIENIFALRLKNVRAETISDKLDLVEEYIKYGISVYIEEKADGGYRIGLLNPEFYNLDVFEIGTEFEVLGVEGEVISTGRIESVSTEIPKE